MNLKYMGNIGNIVAAILMAGTPLLIFEAISRQYKISPELTRKSVHVLTAAVVAYMTFFLNLNEIVIVSVLFLVFFVATRKYYIWQSLFKVQRKSYGEITFTIGVILAALIAQDERIFACSILVMGLADPAAAVIGQHYKKAHVFFNSKTIEGTAGFFLITIFLLGAFGVASLQSALFFGAIITLAELVSKNGLDNILVPLTVVLLLNFI